MFLRPIISTIFKLKPVFVYWNRLLFCIKGIKMEKGSQIYNRVYLNIHPTARVSIGRNFKFTSGAGGGNPLCRNIRGAICAGQHATITIGSYAGISSACIWATQRIDIGNHVMIGGGCILLDSDAHNLDWRVRSGLVYDEFGHRVQDTATAQSAPICIEDNVLIGAYTIILKGVTIGARSIIGAGSVVTKSVPPDCIAAGNPCKIIRYNTESIPK